VAPHVSAAIVADIDQQQQRHEEIITRLDRLANIITKTAESKSLSPHDPTFSPLRTAVYHTPVPDEVTAFLAGGGDGDASHAAPALAIEEQYRSTACCNGRPLPHKRAAAETEESLSARGSLEI